MMQNAGHEVRVGVPDDFPLNEIKAVDGLVVVRLEAGLCAVANRCPHLPLPLAGGRVENGAITCPFHGSRFDLRTGQNLDWVSAVAGVKLPAWTSRLVALGKSPQPVPAFPVTERDGAVYVRR